MIINTICHNINLHHRHCSCSSLYAIRNFLHKLCTMYVQTIATISTHNLCHISFTHIIWVEFLLWRIHNTHKETILRNYVKTHLAHHQFRLQSHSSKMCFARQVLSMLIFNSCTNTWALMMNLILGREYNICSFWL